VSDGTTFGDAAQRSSTPLGCEHTRPVRSRLLPLFATKHQRRSSVHCRYKCHDACERGVPNRSDNPTFREVAAAAIARRRVLQAGLVLGVAGAAGVACSSEGAAPAPAGPPPAGMAFEPVAPNTDDAVRIPPGYRQEVVVRWGDPVLPGAPAFDPARQSAAAQAMQWGFNNDYLTLVAIPGDATRALLVANHEYTTEPFMHAGYDEKKPTREQIEIGFAAHGMSVLAVDRDPATGRITPRIDPLNRRITATTPFTVTGPAAGDPLLRTTADPAGRTVLGTLNNCSGGTTPWSTVLSGEENVDAYFANGEAVADPAVKASLARYGMDSGATERLWETVDPRFDLLREPNEAHRFGWVVELDPLDPAAPPRKHTALGRFKHEAATVRVAPDGRAVVYMGDDERFEYAYKFVSAGAYRPGASPADREANRALLDAGTLYVARFDGQPRDPGQGADGRGEWLPLVESRADGTARSFVPGMSGVEVLVFTRLAGDAVRATKMDRPEDVEPNPVTGRVYMALTNNDERGTPGEGVVDAANPRTENKNGQVLELIEDSDDPLATRFAWNLLLVCGDPAAADTYYGGFPKDRVSAVSCPDNVAFDPQGNLWVSTDGNALDTNDGLFAVALEGDQRGRTQQFLTVPRGAETCGPVITEKVTLVSVQHPGEVDGASVDAPASHWPDGGTSIARPSVVAVYRDGGGTIGA
jgi:uncharacterized protein